MSKTNQGNFFEDFELGQIIRHATPRTVTAGDQALYTALYGSRFAVQSSDAFARAIGYAPRAGRRSAGLPHRLRQDGARHLAQCGRQSGLCRVPVPQAGLSRRYASAPHRKSSASRKIRTARPARSMCARPASTRTARRCSSYVRWVMVRKRDETAPAPGATSPDLPNAVLPADLGAGCPKIAGKHVGRCARGLARTASSDYKVGETIDHVDGMTVEEAEHMLATRLYQNTAKVHFNAVQRGQGPLRQTAHLWRPCHLAGACAFLQRPWQCIPCGRHQWRPPCGAALRRRHRLCLVGGARQGGGRRAGGRRDFLRIATFATKDIPSQGQPREAATADTPGIVLELDYWAFVPR